MNGLWLQIWFQNCEAMFSEGQSGGIAMFWADGLGVRLISKSKYHIDVEVRAVDGSGVNWCLTGFQRRTYTQAPVAG